MSDVENDLKQDYMSKIEVFEIILNQRKTTLKSRAKTWVNLPLVFFFFLAYTKMLSISIFQNVNCFEHISFLINLYVELEDPPMALTDIFCPIYLPHSVH